MRDPKAAGEFLLTNPALLVKGANLLYRLVGQLGMAAILAFGMTVLLVHVAEVVGLRSQKKVIGANAIPNVAAMADTLVVRGFTEVDLIGKSVNENVRFDAGETKNAIAVLVSGACPEPAFISLLDACPKAIDGRIGPAICNEASRRAKSAARVQVFRERLLTLGTDELTNGRLALHSEPHFRGARGRALQRCGPNHFDIVHNPNPTSRSRF